MVLSVHGRGNRYVLSTPYGPFCQAKPTGEVTKTCCDRSVPTSRTPLLEVAELLSHRCLGAQQQRAGLREAGQARDGAAGLRGSARDRSGVRAGEKKPRGDAGVTLGSPIRGS